MKQISMKDLFERKNQLGTNDLILDVRTAEEYAEGHIAGSRNIPHDQVQEHIQDLKNLNQIYIHCRSGKRSQVATQTLEKLGLKNLICISNSGMQDWVEAGYPVVKGP